MTREIDATAAEVAAAAAVRVRVVAARAAAHAVAVGAHVVRAVAHAVTALHVAEATAGVAAGIGHTGGGAEAPTHTRAAEVESGREKERKRETEKMMTRSVRKSQAQVRVWIPKRQTGERGTLMEIKKWRIKKRI